MWEGAVIMMTLEHLTMAINQRAESRYQVQVADAFELPDVDHPSTVLRLKRQRSTNAGWRTVLLIQLPSTALQAAYQWSADVRDVLPEPETSDLYMFMLIGDTSDNEAARIETDDRFCRKVVARQSEEPLDFLDRTFLASLDPPGNVETLSDPLVSALKAMVKSHPWTGRHMSAWKAELLSTANGGDVVQILSDSVISSENQQ